MRGFLKYHLPAVLYAAAILVVSSIPNLKSPGIRFLATDKLAHMIEYAVLALLAFRSLNQFVGSVGIRSVVGLTFLVLAVMAVADETLQRYVPGRHSDWWDYLADVAGGSLVLVVLWWFRRVRGSPGK